LDSCKDTQLHSPKPLFYSSKLELSAVDDAIQAVEHSYNYFPDDATSLSVVLGGARRPGKLVG